MRFAIPLLLAASLARAGVIQGVLIDQVSGRPLARTIVKLVPIVGPNGVTGPAFQGRALWTGHFNFPVVPEGQYLILAQRTGFFPAAYGQRRADGQGTPVTVTKDSEFFAEIHMHRMAAITGTVLDENGVGMPDITVLAYRAQFPIRSVASAKSDDRGVYRISGLDPGRYWIRSAATTLDDGSGRLPTFGPFGGESRDAAVHDARLDMDVRDANVSPPAGSLFRLAGKVQCPGDAPYNVMLTSETVNRNVATSCGQRFVFEGLAPAGYEVFAMSLDGTMAGFIELQLGSNSEAGSVQPAPLPAVDFEITDARGGSPSRAAVVLFGRRDDLSGSQQFVPIKLPQTVLPPGHWEFKASMGPQQYVESIANRLAPRPAGWRDTRPQDSFDVFIDPRPSARVQIKVSDRAARITGTVALNAVPVAGAPVFLWAMEDGARRSLGGQRQALTDTSGRYSIQGLPPGNYRVFASFDATAPELRDFDEARAGILTVSAGQELNADLALWVAP
jgi:protocatechuate 3,4-dioxygenase beta subunit